MTDLRQPCPRCGCPAAAITGPTCPKCDFDLGGLLVNQLLAVDIAHHGEDWPAAERKLQRALGEALAGRYKGLKVIHGRSHEHVIKTRTLVELRRFAEQHKAKVVPEQHNDGAHILYFSPPAEAKIPSKRLRT